MTLVHVEANLNSKDVMGKLNKSLTTIQFFNSYFIVHLKPIIIYETFYNKNFQRRGVSDFVI